MPSRSCVTHGDSAILCQGCPPPPTPLCPAPWEKGGVRRCPSMQVSNRGRHAGQGQPGQRTRLTARESLHTALGRRVSPALSSPPQPFQKVPGGTGAGTGIVKRGDGEAGLLFRACPVSRSHVVEGKVARLADDTRTPGHGRTAGGARVGCGRMGAGDRATGSGFAELHARGAGQPGPPHRVLAAGRAQRAPASYDTIVSCWTL